MARRPRRFEGPVVLLAAAVAIALVSAAVLLAAGGGEAGVRALIRATARTSLALFLAAFLASTLRRLWRSPASAWLLRNRRQVGLAMALSHGVHLAAIATLALRGPAAEGSIPATDRIAGTFGYGVLALLVLTSSDRAVARLGRARWRALHRACMWALWAVFLVSYAPGARVAVGHAAAAAVLVGAAALRLAGGRPAPARQEALTR